jgi:hypothetical protein
MTKGNDIGGRSVTVGGQSVCTVIKGSEGNDPGAFFGKLVFVRLHSVVSGVFIRQVRLWVTGRVDGGVAGRESS